MVELLTALSRALAPLGEMSLTAAYAALVVALLRLILKKRAPRQVVCLLWLVVFARLLLPVSLESPLSIVPGALPAQQRQAEDPLPPAPTLQPVPEQLPAPEQGTPAVPTPTPVPAPAPSSQTAIGLPQPALDPGPAQAAALPWPALLAGLWLAGAALMGGWGLFSWLRLRRRLFDAIRAEDGAWEHPAVGSPFILGLFLPKIYLPAGLYGQPRQFILCHERAHLRRLDHIVKPVCWTALALHWFNPAVWLAFVLMSRDIEAACDEAVVRQLGSAVKADYSATLLALATGRRLPTPCPLAFDEGDAKGRIRNVLNYRRPRLWVIVVSATLAIAAAVCLLTDPVSAHPPEANPSPAPAPTQPAEGPLPSPSPDMEPVPAPAPDRVPRLEGWMEEVLSGRRQFYNTKTGLWADLTSLSAAYGRTEGYTADTIKTAVLDVDGDGAEELVIAPCYEHSAGYVEAGDRQELGFLFLREEGDEVRGYNPSFREVGDLWADGTFRLSLENGGYGAARVRFTPEGVEAEPFILLECLDAQGEQTRGQVYGQSATWEEVHEAMMRHQAQGDLRFSWYRWFDDTGLVPMLSGPDQSTYTPQYLGDGQRYLYRQASYFYYHLFGESTAGICELDASSYWFSGLYDPGDTVERDGLTYVRVTGQFARWADLMATADALFTREFWETCNRWQGHDIFINVDGAAYFLPLSRAQGDYNNEPVNPFQRGEETEDEVTLTLLGRYCRYREGEDEVQWGQRCSTTWDYTVDYPIRMVRTEDGWRFDEFHYPRTDVWEYSLGHILWRTDPLHTVNGEMDQAALRQVGPDVFLDWGGTSYRLERDVNVSTFMGRMYVLDVDGDGETEASLVYRNEENSLTIAVYERTAGGLKRRTFDTSALISAFNDNVTVEQKSDGGLTLTCRGPWETTSIELSGKVFEGYEWLLEDELSVRLEPAFFYVGLTSEAPLTPPFDADTFIQLTGSGGSGPFVASASFQVDYDGSRLTIGRLWMDPYPEFAPPSP